MKVMMIQILIFIPVVFARKCEVNMISTLPLLCFWYLRKSTNLTYIYTDLLYLQSIKFAKAQNVGKYGVNPFVCIIVLQML